MNRNLQPVAKFAAESNGAFTEAQIRWWIHRAADNGLKRATAIIRIGRRVYIDVDAFDRWLSEQNSEPSGVAA
jgi:hypothetical protein